MSMLRLRFMSIAVLAVLVLVGPASAQDAPTLAADAPAADGPSVSINLNGEGQNLSDLMKIVLVLSVMTLVPAILLTMTGFTRIVIVLSFVRRALSVQQMPPNQVVIGLALFLTAFSMAPVFGRINEVAIQPNLNGEIGEMDAIRQAEGPLRDFMLAQTRKKDLALFLSIAELPRPQTRGDVPTYVLIPAFALSEIKTAFQMGFIVFLPMLVIDIVVATLLTSMGMFMLPPAMVSVPLKILLFVLVDGWHLVIGSLAQSFM